MSQKFLVVLLGLLIISQGLLQWSCWFYSILLFAAWHWHKFSTFSWSYGSDQGMKSEQPDPWDKIHSVGFLFFIPRILLRAVFSSYSESPDVMILQASWISWFVAPHVKDSESPPNCCGWRGEVGKKITPIGKIERHKNEILAVTYKNQGRKLESSPNGWGYIRLKKRCARHSVYVYIKYHDIIRVFAYVHILVNNSYMSNTWIFEYVCDKIILCVCIRILCTFSRWWFQISFFTPIWGRFPFWLIFFKGVETTN